jgi:hypothetical protein
MSFDLRNLRRLGNRIEVPLRTDDNGYLGRECSESECEGYFWVRPGTGLTGEDVACHCPYCGHRDSPNAFYTKEQIEYAKSVALRQITDAFRRDLRQLEFSHPPRGMFGIGISMKLQPGRPVPIRHYREKALETFITCAACTLDYAVYGVFGYCPDCGEHNSLQILERNIDLTRRQVALAETVSAADLQRHLLEDALENCVSAFDGFGREAVRVRAAQSADPARCAAVSFQNLDKAGALLQKLFGVDLTTAVAAEIWATAHRGFMKRHVIAHRAGVVDQAYLDQTRDLSAVVGRKVALERDEVIDVADAVLAIGRTLIAVLPLPVPSAVPPT